MAGPAAVLMCTKNFSNDKAMSHMTRGKQPQGQTYQLQGNVFYVGVARFQDRAIVAGLAALDC